MFDPSSHHRMTFIAYIAQTILLLCTSLELKQLVDLGLVNSPGYRLYLACVA